MISHVIMRQYDTRSCLRRTPIPSIFSAFPTVMCAKHENKIAHLNAGNIKAESGDILLIILTAHGHSFRKGMWMDFRRKDMVTEVTRGPNFDESDDYTNDKLNHEFETLLSELEPRYLREFFGCETEKSVI